MGTRRPVNKLPEFLAANGIDRQRFVGLCVMYNVVGIDTAKRLYDGSGKHAPNTDTLSAVAAMLETELRKEVKIGDLVE